MIVTRFAPSPTGYLHVGSARTALFNYLFAKHNNGKFLLRIEDTDKARSTTAATSAILTSMKWLGLDWDGDIVYQSHREDRHREAVLSLMKNGMAYYCYSSQEEIDQKRQNAIAAGQSFLFQSPWRDADPKTYPSDKKPVVRLKARHDGDTITQDLVQGDVVVSNATLDDMVLLRSDGTPTYMLAVVVDDHDMGVTHIIRGDDHLTNATRQIQLYSAFGWNIPKMAHIPLIHGADGAKLSKRHGAVGVEWYKDAGYLPEALCNYLLRLGWSHGDDEIISREDAIKWFDVSAIGKSPSRLDFAKLGNVNGHYIKCKSDEALTNIVLSALEDQNLSEESKRYIAFGIHEMKTRANLLTDLVDLSKIYIVDTKIVYGHDVVEVIKNVDKELIRKIIAMLQNIGDHLDHDVVQETFKKFAESHGMKIGEVMKPVRALVTGRQNSPSLFGIIATIGAQHTIARLSSAL